MNDFIKTQAVLILGSFADFGITFLIAGIFNCWYVAATIAGNITGAVLQFYLSRNWVFSNSKKNTAGPQLFRFILMWAGNILLSALLTYLLTQNMQLHYLLSKLLVSVILGLSYTYYVSKKIVFAK
ncbi:MAG: GtrA family protein [Ferruginibacter sp.]